MQDLNFTINTGSHGLEGYVDNGVQLKLFSSDLKGTFYSIVPLDIKGRFYATFTVLYIMGTFYTGFIGAYLPQCLELVITS